MLTFSTKNVKLFVLAVVALSVAGFSLSSRERSAHAQVDDTLTKIAQYPTWKRITKEPIRGATLDSLLSATVDAEAIGGG